MYFIPVRSYSDESIPKSSPAPLHSLQGSQGPVWFRNPGRWVLSHPLWRLPDVLCIPDDTSDTSFVHSFVLSQQSLPTVI